MLFNCAYILTAYTANPVLSLLFLIVFFGVFDKPPSIYYFGALAGSLIAVSYLRKRGDPIPKDWVQRLFFGCSLVMGYWLMVSLLGLDDSIIAHVMINVAIDSFLFVNKKDFPIIFIHGLSNFIIFTAFQFSEFEPMVTIMVCACSISLMIKFLFV